jgi:hypothetical protein
MSPLLGTDTTYLTQSYSAQLPYLPVPTQGLIHPALESCVYFVTLTHNQVSGNWQDMEIHIHLPYNWQQLIAEYDAKQRPAEKTETPALPEQVPAENESSETYERQI